MLLQDGLHVPSRLQWLTRNSIILALWFLFMFAWNGPVRVVVKLQHTLAHLDAGEGHEAVEATPHWAEIRLQANNNTWCALSFHWDSLFEVQHSYVIGYKHEAKQQSLKQKFIPTYCCMTAGYPLYGESNMKDAVLVGRKLGRCDASTGAL